MGTCNSKFYNILYVVTSVLSNYNVVNSAAVHNFDPTLSKSECFQSKRADQFGVVGTA